MKLSRNETGKTLIEKLSKIGYIVTRQKGSHIRLTKSDKKDPHYITIPNHNPIKIGTLSRILNDVAIHLEITKEELMKILEK